MAESPVPVIYDTSEFGKLLPGEEPVLVPAVMATIDDPDAAIVLNRVPG